MVKKREKRQADAQNADSSTDSSDDKTTSSIGGSSALGNGVVCQHVKKSVDAQRLRKAIRQNGLATECALCSNGKNALDTNDYTLDDSSFEYDNTLWLCLKCGSQLCGRNKNQHALLHHKTPHSESHALTMNTRSLEIWCYECSNEVSAESRRNLQECVEIVKKAAQKATSNANTAMPTMLNNVSDTIVATYQNIQTLLPSTTNNEQQNMLLSHQVLPLPPPPPPPMAPQPPIPGMAKRISETQSAVMDNTEAALKKLSALPVLSGQQYAAGKATTATQQQYTYNQHWLHSRKQQQQQQQTQLELPRVRGLTNLGNTCFFNAVMQCLAQTPFLLDVLKECEQPGEEFTLPGGTFKFKNETDLMLPPIKGTLSSWGGLTSALAQALEELQSGGGVFTPTRLFEKLCSKCPQFRGGDQHDSHELLRHLLESVRAEDLKRYQQVILQNLGYKPGQNINNVSEEMRQKCKIYGNQAQDRILRPEQVFRGFLVSTLTCQKCKNVSSRHEYFLDMSLPVSVEKPQPPQRRRSSPENEAAGTSNSFFINLNPNPVAPSKAQQKKEKKQERKNKRAAKNQNNKLMQKQRLEDAIGVQPNEADEEEQQENDENAAKSSAANSSTSESDADVEDNLIDDNAVPAIGGSAAALSAVGKMRANMSNMQLSDTNGNSRPLHREKYDDSPENMEKDSLEEDENDSGIANSPAHANVDFPTSAVSNGDVPSVSTNNSVVAVGLSEKGAHLVRQLSLGDTSATATTSSYKPINGEINNDFCSQLDELKLVEQKKAAATATAAGVRISRQRTQSYSDWSNTIAPRYQCEDGECSVQSCLNNFTAVELMTGSNKVGCDNCTRHLHGNDPKAKTEYTNATKQFLISSPPAVLILHLKRFQITPRCMFRKLMREVDFPMVLDIAPFCGSKVKNLPNIDRKQKKLLYALYGIVEHSGSMYGGHYVAYVKVRAKLTKDDKRWKFIPQGSKAELDQDDEQRKKLDELLAKQKAREMRMTAAEDSDDFSNSCGSSSSNSSSELEDAATAIATSATESIDETANVQVPDGKWYHVSDSHVTEASEERVLKAQAYLLFYERIY